MAKDLLRLSLADIIPSSIADDPNVQAIVRAVDPELQSVSQDIRETLILSRLDELPEPVVDLLAWQFHVDLYEPTLPIDVKRTLVRDSIPWHRKKGTRWAVRRALENLGFVPTIKEWFEPDMGTEPHTFSVSGYYKDDPLHIDFLGPDTENILIRAVEMAKPVRSYLIFLMVAPPPPDMADHICRWDWCTWDHGTAHEYTWDLLPPAVGFLEKAAAVGITLSRTFFGAYSREDRWDVELWDHGRHSGMADVFAGGLGSTLFGSWEDYAPRHKWHKKRTWRCGGTWRRSCERAAVAVIGFKEVD